MYHRLFFAIGIIDFLLIVVDLVAIGFGIWWMIEENRKENNTFLEWTFIFGVAIDLVFVELLRVITFIWFLYHLFLPYYAKTYRYF